MVTELLQRLSLNSAFTKCLWKSCIERRSALGDGFTPKCLGGSSIRRRSLDNEIPEHPDNKKNVDGELFSTEAFDEASAD